MSSKDQLMISLRIKGFAKLEAMAEAHAIPAETCFAWINDLKAGGFAEDTKVGVRLTPAGREAADAMIRTERSNADQAEFAAAGEIFTPINSAFKQLVTRWQMREVDGKQVRNDHGDSAYDGAVLGGFGSINADVGRVIDAVATSVPRFAAYRRRLAAALSRIDNGDTQYVAGPQVESYHTIWFELHQDLIGLLGTTRAKEAAAGRAV